jgi:hypothetical protein
VVLLIRIAYVAIGPEPFFGPRDSKTNYQVHSYYIILQLTQHPTPTTYVGHQFVYIALRSVRADHPELDFE